MSDFWTQAAVWAALAGLGVLLIALGNWPSDDEEDF